MKEWLSLRIVCLSYIQITSYHGDQYENRKLFTSGLLSLFFVLFVTQQLQFCVELIFSKMIPLGHVTMFTKCVSSYLDKYFISDIRIGAWSRVIVTGITAGNEEFQQAIRRAVPDGHTFKGYPIQFVHRNSRRAFSACLK